MNRMMPTGTMEKVTTVSLASVLLLTVSWAGGQEPQKQKTEEEIHAEQSRTIFDATHCETPNPDSVKAFSGCWRIASVWDAPSEKNLKLGMNLTSEQAKILLSTDYAGHFWNSGDPRYCSFQGASTLAPHPNANFSKNYTYVYAMLDMPKEQSKQLGDLYYRSLQEKMSRKKYQKIINKFIEGGGTYIRTFIVFSPDNIVFDMDLEEDFWAIPVPCDGWQQVEKQIENTGENVPEIP